MPSGRDVHCRAIWLHWLWWVASLNTTHEWVCHVPVPARLTATQSHVLKPRLCRKVQLFLTLSLIGAGLFPPTVW